MGSVMEYLSTASLPIWHSMADVTGAKEENRSDVEMLRNTGDGAPSEADLTSETLRSKKSAKVSTESPGSELRMPFLSMPIPSFIARQRGAGSRGLYTDPYVRIWVVYWFH